jgi:hypothetical protein
MQAYLPLGKFSFGMGDRFGHQGKAQLRACLLAREAGAEVVPVWNKSNREHLLIGTEPASLRAEADAAVAALQWRGPWHVDADHIRLSTVDRFIPPSDFFTLDVADFIGRSAHDEEIAAFVDRHADLQRRCGLTHADLEQPARKFLFAVREAAKIHRHIAMAKGAENFITEISMDETDHPQSPSELLVILAAVADEQIPLQTIAPKFPGRFNKGVDYDGDPQVFEQEFQRHLETVGLAIREFGLPPSLKLSVHSGSDKFSLYEPIRRSLKKFDAGIHVKTAGTTWIEEMIGMAEVGDEGLSIVREICVGALAHIDELAAPYATVLEIKPADLPAAEALKNWSPDQFVAALRHDPRNPDFNSSLRQLVHVSFKLAAAMGGRFYTALREHESAIAKNVTANLFERHLKPLLLGSTEPIRN